MPNFTNSQAKAYAARACGIDFGTSNSTVAWQRSDAESLLLLEQGKPTLPSAVFFNSDEDTTCFGRQAISEYLEGYEGRLMRSLKSLLGSALIDGQTEVQGRVLSFRSLLSSFIGELKRRAELAAGRSFDTAVFGRPVHFIDDDAEADHKAQQTLHEIAMAVGFKEVSFQFEPIAAAFHYEQTLQSEKLVLVADIGGGTSDFSIIRLSPERQRASQRQTDVLANAGIHLGGTDFDKYLSLAQVLPLFGYRSRLRNNAEVPSSYYFNLATWHTINSTYSRKVWQELQDVYRDALDRDGLARLLRLIEQRDGHWLAFQTEQAKIGICGADHFQLDLQRISAGLQLDLQRQSFEQAIQELVTNIAATVTTVLQQAQTPAAAIDTVFITGGSSAIPLLRQQLAQLLPAAELVEGDLFGSIGTGLAIEAWRRYGE